MAQVLILGPSAEHVVDGGQDGVSDSHSGAVLTSTRGQPVVLGCQVRVLDVPGSLGGFNQSCPQPFVPMPGTLIRFPALRWLPGQTLAQEARWAAVGNRLMSVPTSACISSAPRRPTPGISSSRSRVTSNGHRRLHDVNKSGFWILIGIIPIFGPLTLIFLWFIAEGDEGENRYGLTPVPTPEEERLLRHQRRRTRMRRITRVRRE